MATERTPPLLLAALATLAAAATASGCESSSLRRVRGEQCELNSDCDPPLVCRIGYCRVECASARDCSAGLDCVIDIPNDPSAPRYGACQLEAETSCVRDSDCPAALVCTMGECTNECGCPLDEPCRDCAPGATCVERDDGSRACLDTSTQACVYDSDCDATPDSFVCAGDGRCRIECRLDHDEDCRNGERCQAFVIREPVGEATGNFCVFLGAGSSVDGGTDASVDAGGSPADAGVSDSGAPPDGA